jgi:hypothetical protein
VDFVEASAADVELNDVYAKWDDDGMIMSVPKSQSSVAPFFPHFSRKKKKNSNFCLSSSACLFIFGYKLVKPRFFCLKKKRK